MSSVRGPWVLLGDLNVPPAELIAAGWVARFGGQVVVPPTSCTQQAGRVLDYVILSTEALPRLHAIGAAFCRGWRSLKAVWV